jgi:hypothetical protein
MTVADFISKWSRFSGKEASAYQDHFSDLCRVLAHATPIAADPTGNDTFCFQKRVVKDAELFETAELFNAYAATDEERHAATRGFADVWLKGHFAWEYKGPGGDLEEAYLQLLRYRESLLNPPLLVVCDFHRFIIRTNFNGTVQQTYDIPLAKLDRPENLRVLRAVFSDPDSLRPERTAKLLTEQLADRIAGVARSLQGRESIELRDTRTRQEHRVAQRRNLRIAQFLNRLTFCFFAEDVGLLPTGVFSEIVQAGLDDPAFFSQRVEALFRAMSGGGVFGAHRIRHFNGHLFEEATVFELTRDEIAALSEAAAADWQDIDPSIFGTLFQRALDDEHRAQLGAHYTSPEDIKTLLEPVLMAPLRQQWTEIKRTLRQEYRIGKAPPAARKTIEAFLKRLRETIVLDPACGSGNFLYLALQLLLDLEKEVLAFAARMGREYLPQVSVDQLRAIEINPYAYELAQVSVQIGFLQWMRANGFPLDRTPVLQTLAGFENEDALMREMFGRKHANLKDAQAAEHATDTGIKAYNERNWPECSVIVGNPPFLGDKLMRRELGDEYVSELRQVFKGRLPGQSDLCCYWFEKARAHIEEGKCQRAGLLATQGIRGGANREVLKRIKDTGDIFWAESDRPWILDGANVHVSMAGFDDGAEETRILDGQKVSIINADLTASQDTTHIVTIAVNGSLSYQGPVRVGDFDVSFEDAVALLHCVNPNGKPTSDVLRPTLNGTDITKRPRERWVIDFFKMPIEASCLYEKPFAIIEKSVRPLREESKREGRKTRWWQHGETGDAMRVELANKARFLAMSQTGKRTLFRWYDSIVYPEQTVILVARSDDLLFGLLHSRIHEAWALRMGTRLETRPRYTPTTCFETFPFPPGVIPEPRTLNPAHAAIAAAAKELNALRENWLNPPEWTREEILEFPGTVNGPWDRYIVPTSVSSVQSVFQNQEPRTKNQERPAIGRVRYPRTVPHDAQCAAHLKSRTLTKLYNERPAWLAACHAKLDAAVAAVYDWPADLSDESILERLLVLNLENAK